jgi:hypothetical protein
MKIILMQNNKVNLSLKNNLIGAPSMVNFTNKNDIVKEDFKYYRREESGYDPSKILFLNVSDASVLNDNNPPVLLTDYNGNGSKYSIDILSVGSFFSIDRAEAQLKTFGSHRSRRHYWLATEFDDPDPSCHNMMTWKDVEQVVNTCRSKLFWRNKKHLNDLTSHWSENFARRRWLGQKKNPMGWVCAQRRFTVALSKLMKIYREGKDKYGIELPDYLILGDADTHVNIELLKEELIRIPHQEVKEKNLTAEEEEVQMRFPTQNTAVVYAGCRVRSPMKQIQHTFPFGGYGTFFSKKAIERFIQPLHCNGASTGFELEACEHFKAEYQNKWGIGELEYFEAGMSISDLMGVYTRKEETFCLHSDWAVGYFVNHFNISRHVVPTLHLHPKLIKDDAYWYNDQMGDVKHARLHNWNDGSEIYKRHHGNCNNDAELCEETSQVCHKMSEDLLYGVHEKVKALHPSKFRDL